MRDHLLGCAQFIPDVENEPTHFVTLRRRYPLGTPSRVHRDLESHVVKSMEDGQQITAFEDHDHTPAGMMADFPREYDLKTMLGEAADRRDAVTGDWGSWGKSLYDLMQEYDERAALSKVEDWERKVFEARLTLKKPVHVGVDLGKPGGDMSAVAVRRGPEMTYAGSWRDVQRYQRYRK